MEMTLIMSLHYVVYYFLHDFLATKYARFLQLYDFNLLNYNCELRPSSPIQGKYEIVKLLLKHGADASKKNRDGHTPLDLVKEGDQVRGVCTKFLRP
jgi:ankyrin repeat protein